MMRMLRVAVIVASVAFMVVILGTEWEKIRTTDWAFRADLLTLSLIGAVILFFLDAYGWHLILKALGQHLPPTRSMHVWLVSSLARYLPGGVWGYASRVALAKAENVDVATASLSLYLETLLLMASSLAVGSIALWWGAGLQMNLLLTAGICLLPGLLLHPRAMRLLGRLPGRIGAAMRDIRLPSLRHMVTLYVYYFVFWILFGVVFVLFVTAMQPVSVEYWLPVGSSIALGFFVGFVMIFAPGGIGVRESALYVLLLPFMPAPACLVISIASRLWIMAAEAVSVVAILFIDKLTGRAAVRNGR